jgi:general secretion pathway protein J
MQMRARQQGFTLIEVVVSLTLLAIMSVMAYQALAVVLDTNERSRQQLAAQSRLQRAWSIIGRDLWHLRNRSFSDGLGKIELPYMTDPSDFGVRFSRGGGPMLAANPSGVSRVYYSLNDDHQLMRTTWAITDSPRDSDGSARALIDGVEEVVFEHLGAKEFSVNWPPLGSGGGAALPRMVRVTIELQDGQRTSRLYPGVTSD